MDPATPHPIHASGCLLLAAVALYAWTAPRPAPCREAAPTLRYPLLDRLIRDAPQRASPVGWVSARSAP